MNIYWAHLGPNFTQAGSNWSRIGSNWLPIWTPFGPQGIPLAPLGPHWEPDRFGDRFGNLASSQVRCLRIRSAFLELTTGTAGANEVVARGAAQGPPPTRARGQDDGSYTNSLKLQKKYENLNHYHSSFLRVRQTRPIRAQEPSAGEIPKPRNKPG